MTEALIITPKLPLLQDNNHKTQQIHSKLTAGPTLKYSLISLSNLSPINLLITNMPLKHNPSQKKPYCAIGCRIKSEKICIKQIIQ